MEYAALQHALDTQLVRDGFWTRYCVAPLIQRFPRRMKRMIFLSSITAMVKDIREPEKAVMEKLNRLLKLANNQEAMGIPMVLHGWFWRNRLKEKAVVIKGEAVPLTDLSRRDLSNDDYLAISEYFMLHAPKWLIYGSVYLIARDLEVLFRNLSFFDS